MKEKNGACVDIGNAVSKRDTDSEKVHESKKSKNAVSKKHTDSEKVQESKKSKISTVLDNLECTESVSINNALDHICEVVIDARWNFFLNKS